MDKRNLCDIARLLFEDEENRDAAYSAFTMGAQFMHDRLTWLIGEAAQSDDGTIDPAFLDWIARDLHYAQHRAPQWETKAPEPKRPEEPPPPLPVRGRNVMSDRRDGEAYAIFGEGWNPDRFWHLWALFERDIMPNDMPIEARNHMRGTFLAGIGATFWDIARAYTKAANARNPEAFRIYLRDFRRSLERVMQPANAKDMH